MPKWLRSADADVRVVDAPEGRVETVPPRKRVAIVGFSSSSRDQAPWLDPTYELWGMNDAYAHFQRRPDRWFEIHATADRIVGTVAPTYLRDLADLSVPIYVIQADPSIPQSVVYPLGRVTAGVPSYYRRYFTCSTAYMIALAIHEGFETIALYGIDCTIGTEYEAQKPCVESWCSLAMGRGVEVVIPPTSALFKTAFLYGYEPARSWPRVLHASEEFLRGRIEGFKVQHNESLQHLHKLEGAIEELSALLLFAESKGRGSQFPLLEDTDVG